MALNKKNKKLLKIRSFSRGEKVKISFLFPPNLEQI